MRLRTLVVHLLLLIFAAASLTAQPQQSTADVWRAFAEKLASGAFVAVSLKSGERIQGHVVQVSTDGLYLNPKTRIAVPVRVLPFDTIQSIEIQKEGMSPGAKTLMWVGIAGGSLLALLAALAVAFGGS